MDIVGTSISSIAVILFITILRILLINKISKRAISLMWTIAVMKLLIPTSLFCCVSVSLTTTAENSVDFMTNTQYDGFPGSPYIVLFMDGHMDVLKYVWIFGAVFIFSLFLFEHIRSRKRFACALPVDIDITALKEQFTIKRNISVRVSDLTDTPLTYGIFSPVIILPKIMDFQNEVQIKNVMLHELAHIKSFDVFKKLSLIICVSIHWFNPFAWIMSALANRDIELSCDENALYYGNTSDKDYAMTLINLEEKRSYSGALSFTGGKLKERIVGITYKGNKKLKFVLSEVAVIASVAIAFVVNVAIVSGDNIFQDAVAEEISDVDVMTYSIIEEESYVSDDNIDNFAVYTIEINNDT